MYLNILTGIKSSALLVRYFFSAMGTMISLGIVILFAWILYRAYKKTFKKTKKSFTQMKEEKERHEAAQERMDCFK